MREPKAGFDERVGHQRGIDGDQELVKAGVLMCRDQNCFAIAREVREVMARDRSILFKTWITGLVETASSARTFSPGFSALRA